MGSFVIQTLSSGSLLNECMDEKWCSRLHRVERLCSWKCNTEPPPEDRKWLVSFSCSSHRHQASTHFFHADKANHSTTQWGFTSLAWHYLVVCECVCDWDPETDMRNHSLSCFPWSHKVSQGLTQQNIRAHGRLPSVEGSEINTKTR